MKDSKAFPGSSDGKASACNARDLGSIPGWGRSPGEGNGNPLQYSCLEDPVDRGAWWVSVHGIAKSRTRLSDKTHTHTNTHTQTHTHKVKKDEQSNTELATTGSSYCCWS